MWLKRPVYRSFSGEGKCEGKLSPLTLALTPSWISLAVIRPVSLRLQNEGQKKLTDCSLSLQKIATKSHKNIKNKDKAMITEDSSLPLSFEGRIGLSKR